MNDATPRAGPPPKSDARRAATTAGHQEDKGNGNGVNYTTTRTAVEAVSTIIAERRRLERLATDIAPHGELRRYLPTWPLWCRRIGRDVIQSLGLKSQPDPSEIQLLLDAHARATGRRDRERRMLLDWPDDMPLPGCR